MNSIPLLEVKGLKKYFPITGGGLLSRSKPVVKRAVDGVSFNIEDGEIFGLVGEFGAGKTTLARTIMRLYEPTAGEVYFKGRNVHKLKEEELKETRKDMQMIFSNPYTSLNPRRTLGDMLNYICRLYDVPDPNERILDILKKVGLEPYHLPRYPHEFSGGQRQRIGIARGLILKSKFLIADEPTIQLDQSVKAAILNLMKDLQKELKITYLFISNDLSEVRHMSDRIAIMYAGKIVELAPSQDIFTSPQHVLTQHLLRVLPLPDPDVPMKPPLLKRVEVTPESGCPLHPRCPYAETICEKEVPELTDKGRGHYVACHLK